LEVWVDFGINDENAGSALLDPGAHGIEIRKRSHRRPARAVAACDRRKIGLRKLHDIDRVALPPEKMDLGRVGTVVVDENAQPQPKTDCGLEISDRHQEAAIAGTE